MIFYWAATPLRLGYAGQGGNFGFNSLGFPRKNQPLLTDFLVGRPAGIEPTTAVPQTAVITTSLWPPYSPGTLPENF